MNADRATTLEAAMQRVPILLRPAGIKKTLDEAAELLNRLKAVR